MVTVFNLRRQGASESLLYETRQVFSLLLQSDVRISASHVPGVNNVTADAFSRMDSVGDYALKTEIFNRATKFLETYPSIDAFASEYNHKCTRFLAFTARKGKGALGLDALRFSWLGETVYTFLPIQLIPRVLKKMWQEGCQTLLVVSEWSSRHWWNPMQSGVMAQVRLGNSETVLIPGSSMIEKGDRVPPGQLIMARSASASEVYLTHPRYGILC
jgi:hypothetical protein